jgi:hypothetical protein
MSCHGLSSLLPLPPLNCHHGPHCSHITAPPPQLILHPLVGASSSVRLPTVLMPISRNLALASESCQNLAQPWNSCFRLLPPPGTIQPSWLRSSSSKVPPGSTWVHGLSPWQSPSSPQGGKVPRGPVWGLPLMFLRTHFADGEAEVQLAPGLIVLACAVLGACVCARVCTRRHSGCCLCEAVFGL